MTTWFSICIVAILCALIWNWWRAVRGDDHDIQTRKFIRLARKSDEYLDAPLRARDRAIWNIIKNARRKRK